MHLNSWIAKLPHPHLVSPTPDLNIPISPSPPHNVFHTPGSKPTVGQMTKPGNPSHITSRHPVGFTSFH